MLQHTAGLSQIYNKTRFTKKCTRKYYNMKHACSIYFNFSFAISLVIVFISNLWQQQKQMIGVQCRAPPAQIRRDWLRSWLRSA